MRKRVYAPVPIEQGRKKQAKRVIVSVPRTSLLGNQQKVTLKYSDFFSINPLSGLFGGYVFSANGCYDPNITGVGHQPRGFDQLMALFDHYVVIHSSIKVCQLENTTADETNHWMAVTLQDSVTNFSNKTDIFECRHTKWQPMFNAVRTPAIKMEFNNGFLGRSKPLADPQLKGDVASNPTEGAFYHIYYGTDGADDPSILTFRADIEYTVILIEPKTPTES